MRGFHALVLPVKPELTGSSLHQDFSCFRYDSLFS